MSAVILNFPRRSGKATIATLPSNLQRQVVAICQRRGLSAGETASVLVYSAQMHDRGDSHAAILATAREAARKFRDGGPGAA